MKPKWLLVFSPDWRSPATIYNHTESILITWRSVGVLCVAGVFSGGSNETKMVVGVFLGLQITYLQHDYLLSVKSETPMSLF